MITQEKKIKIRALKINRCALLIIAAAVVVMIAATTVIALSYDEDSEKDGAAIAEINLTENIKTEEIAPETEYVDDPNMYVGESKVLQEGCPGIREIKSVIVHCGGETVGGESMTSSVIAEPQNRIIAQGTRNPEVVTAMMPAGTVQVSDSGGMINGMKYSSKINMTATAYSTSPSENGGYTVSAMGSALGFGIVAVDPKVVPLGSKVYVTSADGSWNYGIASAEDTGGAIKGNRIDLCYEGTVSEVNMFGRRECVVYVLE